jgi:hypothetical protein
MQRSAYAARVVGRGAANSITIAPTDISAALVDTQPVANKSPSQMHRLHHKEADDSVTSLLRDMMSDSKTGSMFHHRDAPDKRQEPRVITIQTFAMTSALMMRQAMMTTG